MPSIIRFVRNLFSPPVPRRVHTCIRCGCAVNAAASLCEACRRDSARMPADRYTTQTQQSAQDIPDTSIDDSNAAAVLRAQQHRRAVRRYQDDDTEPGRPWEG